MVAVVATTTAWAAWTSESHSDTSGGPSRERGPSCMVADMPYVRGGRWAPRYPPTAMSITTDRPARGAGTALQKASVASGGRRRGHPLWAIELLDVLDRRGLFALWVGGVLAAIALLIATVAPGVVPPSALGGVTVAVPALAVGLALALALDTLDVRVRGPRHVRSSGGELVALLPSVPTDADADDLASSVLEVRPAGTPLHLGLAPVADDPTATVEWTRALAQALARTGVSVLLVDLTAGASEGPGILEVVRDRLPLSDVVTYADGLPLAEAGAGRDHLRALQALVTFPSVLPADVEILLVALPPVVNRSTVNAARILDQVLLVGEAHLTSRVELMASLDALRVAGCSPQIVLVDGLTYARLRPQATAGLVAQARATRTIPPLPLDGVPTGRVSSPVTIEVSPAVTVPVTLTVPVPAPEPVAQPAPVVQSFDPPRPAGEPSAPIRTVDVLDEAARARAEAILEASLVDTIPMSQAEVHDRVAASERAAVVTTDELPAPAPPPSPAPTPPPERVSPPAPALALSSAVVERPVPPRVPVDSELTTELAASTGMPSWASLGEEDDLLRTTVQMSAFEDELDLRDDGR